MSRKPLTYIEVSAKLVHDFGNYRWFRAWFLALGISSVAWVKPRLHPGYGANAEPGTRLLLLRLLFM